MAKQLLIYDTAVPITARQHRDISVKVGSDYRFAKGINSVPLMAAEFEPSCGEYPIVFAGDDAGLMPAAMLGVRDAENVHVGETGTWTGRYIPAFLRRYPFVFALNDAGDTFTLCIDETYHGVNRDGVGERLFDSAGERTQYTRAVLGFLQAYQTQFQATRALVRSLQDLNLFDPMEANFAIPSGQRFKLGGFKAVNRDRLRQLDGDALAGLARTGALDAVYAHLHSLRNFTPTAERIASAVARNEALPDEVAPVQDEQADSPPSSTQH